MVVKDSEIHAKHGVDGSLQESPSRGPLSGSLLTRQRWKMKPEQLYQELKHLAEKLGLCVSEQNFRTTGIHVRSGICKIKNEHHFIIDKHLSLSKKTEVLAECLSQLPHESIYTLPAVRDFLDRFKPKQVKVAEAAAKEAPRSTSPQE